jgi:hypothetical protein
METSGATRQVTGDITRRMCIARLISKATDKHSEYVTRIVFHDKINYSNAPQCDIYKSIAGLLNILHVSGRLVVTVSY